MVLSIIEPPEDDTPVLALADFENMAIIINAALKRNAFRKFDEFQDATMVFLKVDRFVNHIKDRARKEGLLNSSRK